MAVHNSSQPEPVLTRAGITTTIAVLSALLIHVGLPQAAQGLADVADPLAGVVLAVSTLVSAYLARAHVTPVASPRDNDGAKLEAPTLVVPAIDGATDAYVLGTPTDLPAT